MNPQRWPSAFLASIIGLVFLAFANDRLHAEDASNDIVIVPAAIERDMLPELAPDLPAHALALPASEAKVQPTVSVEVVRPTWWDDLWGVLLPLLAAGGTYLGIWLYVQGRRLLASNAVRDADEKRKSDERGHSGVGLLAALVVLALVPLLLSTSAGCGLLGPVQVHADERITWQRRPGPTCYVATLADGEIATETTAPFACVPPPEFCQPGPGEPGYITPEVTP